jgi:Flp pilus assembly protein TadB
MLVRFGAKTAFLATAIAALFLNLVFLHLLYLERDLQRWVQRRAKRLLFLEQKLQAVEHGKNLAVLTVYLVSGPAMAGAPLIWLLGIKGIRAYVLVIFGTFLNSLVWVMGIYNSLWFLIREVAGRI